MIAKDVQAALVAAEVPVDWISIGRRDDKRTWEIHFAEGATEEQKAAAQAVIDAFDPDSVPAPVPTLVTAGRMLIELDARGLLDQVDTAVNAAGGLTKRLWDRAPTFERRDPLVIGIATALGKDGAWLDGLFRSAAQR